MMRVFLYVLAGIAVLLVVFLIVASRQPDTFRVERAAIIAAPPAKVFVEVDDLHNWPKWSPWQDLDPNMTQTYSGPQSGAGASMAWSGNSKAGQGRMTIVESHPNDLVRIRLEFIKPFSVTNASEFTFSPGGNQTVVTWTMTGQNNLMFKSMHMVMNMDKMRGGDFERGLAKLKAVSEAK
jgi:uncharacterized protein YndB with AHSA1/START domain